MKKVMSRILSCALAFLLVIPAMPSALAGGTPGFTDVPDTEWYYGDVWYMAQEGLMNGVGDGVFDPNAPLTRAMFVTILGRIECVNADYYVNTGSFSDVEPGSWYAPYVAWAAKHDITNGVSATEFAPNTNITREQMSTLIARYVNQFGVNLIRDPYPADHFEDAHTISSWAVDAVELMRQTGIIRGDAGNFNPKENATRAQAAAVFSRVIFATPEDYGTPVEGVDYKVTYSAARSYEDNLICAEAIGVVENIGDKTLNIWSANAEITDRQGILIAVPSLIMACPQILAPGQKAYLCESNAADTVPPGQTLNAKFRITAEFTRDVAVRYEVSNVDLRKAEFHEIDAFGYVTNNTQALDDIHVAVVLFDQSKNPVGILEEWVYDVPPGVTAGFKAEGVFLPPDITLDTVASYEVYAFPW